MSKRKEVSSPGSVTAESAVFLFIDSSVCFYFCLLWEVLTVRNVQSGTGMWRNYLRSLKPSKPPPVFLFFLNFLFFLIIVFFFTLETEEESEKPHEEL